MTGCKFEAIIFIEVNKMKKRILTLVLAVLAGFSIFAQNLKEDVYNNDLSSLKKKVKLLDADFSGTAILADYMKTRDNEKMPFDLKMFNYLIENKADINLANQDGFSPLHYAVSRNQLDAVKLLIKNGADLNIKTKEKRPALYYAIYNDNLTMVKTLVEAGCDVSPVWTENYYNYLVKNSNRLDYLIKDYSSSYKVSPVLQALFCHNEEILPYLLKKGSDYKTFVYSEKNIFYFTAKFLSEKRFYDSSSYYYDDNIPDYIFANIVNLWKVFSEDEKKVLENFTPNLYTKFASNDMKAVKQTLITTEMKTLDFLPYALLSGKYEIVNLILKYNDLEINDLAFNGQTLMEWALKNKHMSSVRLLAKHGASLPDNGEFLLSAIYNDNLELVKVFLENGMTIKNDSSYLEAAIRSNNQKIVSYLIEKGADVKLNNPIQHTSGKSAIRNLLIKNGADVSTVFTWNFSDIYIYNDSAKSNYSYEKEIDMAYLSCLNGNVAELKFYLEKGISIKRDEKNASLLFACIFGKSPECLKFLLQTDPTLNQNIQNNVYQFYGTIENAKELLKALIKASDSQVLKIKYEKMLKILEQYPA